MEVNKTYFHEFYDIVSRKHSYLLYSSNITTEEWLNIVELEIKRMIKLNKIKKIVNKINNET
jgi:hypothetical protein